MYYDEDAPTNVQGTPGPATPPGRPLSQDQKSAIAAALAGTAALGGAAYGMAQYLDEDETGSGTNNTALNDTDPPKADPESIAGNGGLDNALAQVNVQPVVHISDINRDEMTFEDAFRAARQEMGPGHYFEWKGNLYNTFFQDEWASMSPSEHREFLATVYGPDGIPGENGGMLAGGEIPSHGHEAVSHVTAASHVAAASPVMPDDPDVLLDPDVEVADVMVDDTPTPVNPIQGILQNADVALAELDGQQVSVFDSNHDGRPDAILNNENNLVQIDTDHDHILDSQAQYDPVSHKLTDIRSMDQRLAIDGDMDVLHNSESNLAHDPNFDNNADITDYTT